MRRGESLLQLRTCAIEPLGLGQAQVELDAVAEQRRVAAEADPARRLIGVRAVAAGELAQPQVVIAQQQDPRRAGARRAGDEMVQHLAAVEAAIHQIAQMDHERVAGRGRSRADRPRSVPRSPAAGRAARGHRPPRRPARPRGTAGGRPRTAGSTGEPARARRNRRFSIARTAVLAAASHMVVQPLRGRGPLHVATGRHMARNVRQASRTAARRAAPRLSRRAGSKLSEERCLGTCPISPMRRVRGEFEYLSARAHRAAGRCGRRRRDGRLIGRARQTRTRFVSEVA